MVMVEHTFNSSTRQADEGISSPGQPELHGKIPSKNQKEYIQNIDHGLSLTGDRIGNFYPCDLPVISVFLYGNLSFII